MIELDVPEADLKRSYGVDDEQHFENTNFFCHVRFVPVVAYSLANRLQPELTRHHVHEDAHTSGERDLSSCYEKYDSEGGGSVSLTTSLELGINK